MSLPYETFLKDTTSSYSEFHTSLARLDVLACIRESLCSSTLLILRGRDLMILLPIIPLNKNTLRIYLLQQLHSE